MDSERWRQLCYWLVDPRRRLVWHNGKFDLLHLDYATRGVLLRNPAPKSREQWLRPLVEGLVDNTVWDTMLAQKVMEGFASVGLKETARRLWGDSEALPEEELDQWFLDHKQKTNPRYADVPWALVSKYARQDVELTLRLFEYQMEILEETGDTRTEKLIYRELEFMKVLLQMERRGIQYDAASSRAAAQTLRAEMLRLEAQLPFRATLPAAKRYFFEELALTPKNRTKSGAPALTERDVDELAKDDVPHARIFARRQAYLSAVTKWFEAWANMTGEDGRLRTSFNQTNVRSARLAVSRAQLQAIPHERHLVGLEFDRLGVPSPRELFGAKKGHELWEVDLSQGEVRIAAAVASCKNMREIVSTPGADVHGETCKRVFGIDKDAPDWKAKRDIAKRLTFGMIYGAGARTLVETVHKETGIAVTESDMRDMIATYKDIFPEFFVFAKRAEYSCQEKGYIVLITGKKRYFQFGPPLFEEARHAWNGLVQGGLAEVMRDAMLEVERVLPGTLLLQVHDSLIVELPRKTAKRDVECVRTILVNCYEKAFKIPFQADAARWTDKQ